MKKFAFCILGLLLGTVFAWSGLLLWAALSLNPNDSLFDRSPTALQLFLIFWCVIAALGVCAGLWIATRMQRDR